MTTKRKPRTRPAAVDYQAAADPLPDVGDAFDLDQDGVDGATAEQWAELRAAIDSGDPERIEAARRDLELSREQIELARLCVAEYARLETELAELQRKAARVDELAEQLDMLSRHRAASTDEALALGKVKVGLGRDLHEAEAAAATAYTVEHWLGGCVNVCPEVFGLHGDDARRAKRLMSYAPPAVHNWIARNWPNFENDWLSYSPPKPEQTKLYRIEALTR